MFDWFRRRASKQKEVKPPSGSPPYALLNAPPGERHGDLMAAALVLQQVAWSYAPDHLAEFRVQDTASLSWRALHRLQRLTCLERMQSEEGQAHLADGPHQAWSEQETEADRRCLELTNRLLSDKSPYRPRPARIWQGRTSQPQRGRPSLAGTLQNASLTHLGGLEVIRIDEIGRSATLDFVPFAEITRIVFGPIGFYRSAWLLYTDGSEEMVWAPALYGLSFQAQSEYLRDGRMTQFCCHVKARPVNLGIGLGQQDWMLTGRKSHGMTLFGIGSVCEVEVDPVPEAPGTESTTTREADPETEFLRVEWRPKDEA